MANYFDGIDAHSRGAWVVHHAKRIATTVGGNAEFPALDTAGKAASLLSQFAASEQIDISKSKVDALAKAVGLNPTLEVPALLGLLSQKRLIELASDGSISVLGLSSYATVGHASQLFDD